MTLRFSPHIWKPFYWTFACCLGFVIGCAKPVEEDRLPFSAWLPIQLGDKTIELQLAHQPQEIKRGLMFRTSLAENRGMLFYFYPPKEMGFWMRNTRIPLDIGYFTADGVLREIYPMYPMDERSVKSRRDDLLIAIEMNQGWYAKNGVQVGAKLDLITLKKWLLRSGVEASRIPF